MQPFSASGSLVAAIRDPRLSRFYEYWLDRKGDRRSPERGDIDPVEFRYLLGHVMLFDLLPSPLRFRVRLHGTALTRRAHYDLTGKLLNEMPDAAHRPLVIGHAEAVAASGEPFVVRRNRMLDGQPVSYEALWLPFSDDCSRIRMLLCGMVYGDCRNDDLQPGRQLAGL